LLNNQKCGLTKENDLLASRVEIRKSSDGGTYLSNIIEREVQEVNNSLSLFKEGSQNRHVAATSMNERSSRSHAVVVLTLNINNKVNGEKTLSQL